MHLPRPRQTLFCIALLAVFGCASAAEAKHPLQESGNTTIDPPATAADRFDEADLDGAIAASHSQRTARPKPQPVAPARTSGDTRALPSRFHSFLPGMFR